jgi:hexokinase
MADLPKDLLEEIKKLEKIFTVPKEKLKEITAHFVSELEKGTIVQSSWQKFGS